MKKVLLLFVAMVFSMAVNAQNIDEELANFQKLCDQLQKSLDKAPKPCGVTEIDDYVDGAKNAAKGAVESAARIHEMYNANPSIDEWTGLATSLATQISGLTEVGKAAADATKAAKDAPKLKAVGMMKNIKWSTDILEVTGKALAEEAKAVNDIIQSKK